MNREDALDLLEQNVKNKNLIKHCLAVESIMKYLAEYLNEDKEKWSLAGLLHDIDIEKCKEDYSDHGLIAENILKDKVDNDIINAIKSHNFEKTGFEPKNKIDFALIAADAISGLIIATALMQPNKKLSDVKVESIVKKFKKKDFARNCSREKMLYCEKLGIDKNKFFEIALKAEQSISNKLGL
ncbi:MAG: HDIG domain-containing protein [Candidatus Aenigmarchaeota archaeon]|nr:HDIG domain-containing protein [Candidatus Aenigmarchaeota archaeon]